MNTFVRACLAILVGVAPVAAQRTSPEETIQREGQLVLTDGARYYAFFKDSTFRSGPLRQGADGMLYTGISGQTINGRWRHTGNSESWVVEGRWGWVNGASLPNDFRRMVMRISRVDGAGPTTQITLQMSAAPVRVYKAYFIIEELVKIAPPDGMVVYPGPAPNMPITQNLTATASGKVDEAEWRIESSVMLEGCVVRLGFAPVPVGTPEPPRAETQVWLLRADGTVIPATRPPDEVRTIFAGGKAVSTTRVRIYQYPMSARSEAISVVVRVGDDFFTELVRR